MHRETMSETMFDDDVMVDRLYTIITDDTGTYSLETVLFLGIVKRSVLEKALKRVGDENVVTDTMAYLISLGYKRHYTGPFDDDGPFYYDGTNTDIDDCAVAELIDDCEPGDFLDKILSS